MREIKFRIYFEDEEPFISEPITLEDLLHGEDIEFRNEDDTLSLPLNDFRFYYKRNQNYKIMQFTGLKDKNGKEIYEGDIVKVPVKRHSSSNWWQDTNINHGETGDFVYKQVKYFKYTNSFSDNLSGFDLADLPITKRQKEEIAKPRGKERTKQCVDDLNYTFIELEVIGNIYENSELLERSINGE